MQRRRRQIPILRTCWPIPSNRCSKSCRTNKRVKRGPASQDIFVRPRPAVKRGPVSPSAPRPTNSEQVAPMSLDICSARSADQELCAVCQSISLSPTTAFSSNLVGPRHGAAAAAGPHVAISIRLGNANINLQRRVANATEVARAARSYPPDGRAHASTGMVVAQEASKTAHKRADRAPPTCRGHGMGNVRTSSTDILFVEAKPRRLRIAD